MWLNCTFLRADHPSNFSISFSLLPSGSLAPTPVLHPEAPSSRGPGPQRYTVLSVAPGGLRSGRLPLQPRVQLEDRGLQRGDFSLWLRPALSADAGEYLAAVRLRNRAFSCRLRLRVGQASSRWGGTRGEGLGDGPPFPTTRRQEGLQQGLRSRPAQGLQRGEEGEWQVSAEKHTYEERPLWRDCTTPGAPLFPTHSGSALVEVEVWRGRVQCVSHFRHW